MAPALKDRRALFYIPWKLDLLGGVDIVIDRLWHETERLHPGRTLIGEQDWERSGEYMDADGRRLFNLNSPEPPSVDGRWPLRYRITLARRVPALLRALRRQHIGVVNAHFPTPHAFTFAYLKKLGLWRGRLVLSFHGTDVERVQPETFVWQTIASQTDAVSACSAALAARIEALGLFCQAPQIIYNGIDIERFLATAAPPLLPPGTRYLLNVGNYVPVKGQDNLLNAFARLAAGHPELRLVCAGAELDGRWLAHLRQVARDLGVDGRVTFLTDLRQCDIAALLRDASCFVHTAHQEGFGIALLEAGACGLPLVATRVGGVPEILPSADFAHLVEKNDIDSLVAAIGDVLANPIPAQERAARLRTRVSAYFSTQTMAAGYMRLLELSA